LYVLLNHFGDRQVLKQGLLEFFFFIISVSVQSSRETYKAIQYLKGAYRKAGEGLFIRACSDRMRGNGVELKRAVLD